MRGRHVQLFWRAPHQTLYLVNTFDMNYLQTFKPESKDFRIPSFLKPDFVNVRPRNPRNLFPYFFFVS